MHAMAWQRICSYAFDIFSIFKPVSTTIGYFSADNNSSCNENTRYPSSATYRTYIFLKSDHFNLPGNRENKFYSNNVWKNRSTPEFSVFGSNNLGEELSPNDDIWNTLLPDDFINVRECRMTIQKWTIQRNWQKQDNEKQTKNHMCWT